MSDKLDMSLDDIIKQTKKKTRPVRGRFQQFRGRVGGKLIKGKNAVNKQAAKNVKKQLRPQQRNQSSRQLATGMKNCGLKNVTKRATSIRQKAAKQTLLRAAQRYQQANKQKQQRQNIINQRRGQVFVNGKRRQNKKFRGSVSDQIANTAVIKRKKLNRNFSVGSLVSDQMIAQQKSRRRWKAKSQKADPVLSVTVPNVSSSDVKVLFKNRKTKPRINRQSLPGSNRNNPVIVVTSPTTDNEVQIITSRPFRRQKRKTNSKLVVFDEPTVTGQQEDVQIKIDRSDFAKASTGVTLDERFSRMVQYPLEQSSPVTGGRQVFL